jgi:hypothetical protein
MWQILVVSSAEMLAMDHHPLKSIIFAMVQAWLNAQATSMQFPFAQTITVTAAMVLLFMLAQRYGKRITDMSWIY